MEKSVFTANYKAFLRLLKQQRQRAGLTQQQIADRIGQSQSFVSKCERGERRIDFVEMMAFCDALEIHFAEFCTEFERAIKRRRTK